MAPLASGTSGFFVQRAMATPRRAGAAQRGAQVQTNGQSIHFKHLNGRGLTLWAARESGTPRSPASAAPWPRRRRARCPAPRRTSRSACSTRCRSSSSTSGVRAPASTIDAATHRTRKKKNVGEMLYILEQRLSAQNVQSEKSVRVLCDVVRTMFSARFVADRARSDYATRLQCESSRRRDPPWGHRRANTTRPKISQNDVRSSAGTSRTGGRFARRSRSSSSPSGCTRTSPSARSSTNWPTRRS